MRLKITVKKLTKAQRSIPASMLLLLVVVVVLLLLLIAYKGKCLVIRQGQWFENTTKGNNLCLSEFAM